MDPTNETLVQVVDEISEYSLRGADFNPKSSLRVQNPLKTFNDEGKEVKLHIFTENTVVFGQYPPLVPDKVLTDLGPSL